MKTTSSILLLAVLATGQLQATDYTLTTSGVWGSTAVFTPAGTPTVDDTIILATNGALTLTDQTSGTYSYDFGHIKTYCANGGNVSNFRGVNADADLTLNVNAKMISSYKGGSLVIPISTNASPLAKMNVTVDNLLVSSEGGGNANASMSMIIMGGQIGTSIDSKNRKLNDVHVTKGILVDNFQSTITTSYVSFNTMGNVQIDGLIELKNTNKTTAASPATGKYVYGSNSIFFIDVGGDIKILGGVDAQRSNTRVTFGTAEVITDLSGSQVSTSATGKIAGNIIFGLNKDTGGEVLTTSNVDFGAVDFTALFQTDTATRLKFEGIENLYAKGSDATTDFTLISWLTLEGTKGDSTDILAADILAAINDSYAASGLTGTFSLNGNSIVYTAIQVPEVSEIAAVLALIALGYASYRRRK